MARTDNMKKKIANVVLLVFCAVYCAGCRSEIQTYHGATGIYFAMPEGSTYANADTLYTDNTPLPFIISQKQDSVLVLKVKLLGKTQPRRRLIPVRVVPELTTLPAEGYDLDEAACLLEAGQVYGKVPVTFHRLPRLQDEELKLTLELVENEEFSLPVKQWRNSSTEYVDVVRHTVVVSDMYVQLPGYAVGHFGPFSQKKMKLLLELFSMKLSDFNEKLPVTFTKALGQKFDRYQKKQAAKGTPVYEEDGVTQMTSGAYIYM